MRDGCPNGIGKSHLVSAIAMVFTNIKRILNHEKETQAIIL